MDKGGSKAARVDVSAIKIVAARLQTRGKGQRGVVRSQHNGHDVRVAPRGLEAAL